MATKTEIMEFIYDEYPCYPLDIIKIIVNYLPYAPLALLERFNSDLCINFVSNLPDGKTLIFGRSDAFSSDTMVYKRIGPLSRIIDITPTYEHSKKIIVEYKSNYGHFVIWINTNVYFLMSKPYSYVNFILENTLIISDEKGFYTQEYVENKFITGKFKGNESFTFILAISKMRWASSSSDGIKIWDEYTPLHVVQTDVLYQFKFLPSVKKFIALTGSSDLLVFTEKAFVKYRKPFTAPIRAVHDFGAICVIETTNNDGRNIYMFNTTTGKWIDENDVDGHHKNFPTNKICVAGDFLSCSTCDLFNTNFYEPQVYTLMSYYGYKISEDKYYNTLDDGIYELVSV